MEGIGGVGKDAGKEDINSEGRGRDKRLERKRGIAEGM